MRLSIYTVWAYFPIDHRISMISRSSVSHIIFIIIPLLPISKMPQKPARLTNTYVPLPLSSNKDEPEEISRSDRKNHELRQLCFENGVLSEALGSSLVEIGHTKVLCEVTISTTGTVNAGVLQCKVRFAPHIGRDAVSQRINNVAPLESDIAQGKLNKETMQMESDLAQELTTALLPVVNLRKFPKCAVDIQVTILQDDGSVLTTCICGSTLALVDASIEIKDMVTSCTVAAIRQNDEIIFLADPTQEESTNAQAIICLAMTPNHKEVTLWRQSGRLTSDMANQAIEICRSGCRTMHRFMREVWVSKA
jgi:ribonuclease PH